MRGQEGVAIKRGECIHTRQGWCSHSRRAWYRYLTRYSITKASLLTDKLTLATRRVVPRPPEEDKCPWLGK